MQEAARLILGLRAAGWTEKEISDFIVYIGSGEEQYRPRHENGKAARQQETAVL